MRLRRINRAVHRDLGYLLAGTTILYAISGLALNHVGDWNSNFVIKRQDVQTPVPKDIAVVTREWVMGVLEPLGEQDRYRSHDFPTPEKVKIYLDEGSVFVDLKTGKGVYETVRRRPLFYQINCLHISPRHAWLVFSDLFAVGLVVVSVTGLVMLKGSKGLSRRGAILAAVGILASLAFLLSVR